MLSYNSNQDRSARIATGYELDAGVRFPSVVRESSLHNVQAASKTQPASFSMGTEDFFSRYKAAEAWI
jgi:hypothetical protein